MEISMKLYLAPMEGITGYVYRNAFEKYFGHIDKYFTPFLTPNQNTYLNRKEKKDVLPEANDVPYLVPQIMTNQPEHFIGIQKELFELGYDEINLNLGCPAATVVTKKKGAGFLGYPSELDDFMYQIFEKNEGKISVKTRLGMENQEEIFALMEIYNRYPLTELIIHPRVREDYYKNQVNLTFFAKALEISKNPVIYNGDIFTVEDYGRISEAFPDIEGVMLGRGILKNPFLVRDILAGDDEVHQNQDSDMKQINEFMTEILNGYYLAMKDERNVLFRMKELWLYLKEYFDEGETYWKKINKTKNFIEYQTIMKKIFDLK